MYELPFAFATTFATLVVNGFADVAPCMFPFVDVRLIFVVLIVPV